MLSSRMPELTALQMICTVQRLGSFSAAGKALGLSQQAVSSRMRALEEVIGSPLLVRSPRGSSLTETGALIADWASDVLAAAERLDAGIASLRQDGIRQLRVVASQTIAEHLLPQWLVILRRQQEAGGTTPTLTEFTVTNSTSAAAVVRAGDADVGFIESPALPAGLASRTVRYDDMVVVVAPGHRWARRRTAITADELARTPLVTRERGSGTREALESILAEQAPESPTTAPIVELSTSAAVRSAIIAGTAPGVLSSLAVRDDLTLGRLVAIPTQQLSLRRPLTAIWRSGTVPPIGPARDLVAIAADVPAGS
jgi:molybdate transport repressor ModE-like protein